MGPDQRRESPPPLWTHAYQRISEPLGKIPEGRRVSSNVRDLRPTRASPCPSPRKDERYFTKIPHGPAEDPASVDPDMKRPVVMGYARSSNDHNGLIDRFKKSATDEERLRYLEGLASFNKPDLVTKALDYSLSGQVKKQDVRNMVTYATAN